MSFTKVQEESAKEIIDLAQVDFYKTLGLPRNCTDADIKKSYRKLALKFHPDKNSAPSAEAAFLALNLAMTTLDDLPSRQRYDTLGHIAAMKGQEQKSGTDEKEKQWPSNWPKKLPTAEILKHLFRNEARSFFSGHSKVTSDTHYTFKRRNATLVMLPSLVIFIVTFVWLYFFRCCVSVSLSQSYSVLLPQQADPRFPELHRASLNPTSLGSPYYTSADFHVQFQITEEVERSIDEEYRLLLAKLCGEDIMKRQKQFAQQVDTEGYLLLVVKLSGW